MGETQFLLNIPEADNINHIVVFLTGTMPLPAGTAGSVYFSWPDPTKPPSWIMLGYISNTKPSTIFKISQFKHQHSTSSATAVVPFGSTTGNIFGAQPISHIAQIGVSIEPEANVINLTPATVSLYLYTVITNIYQQFLVPSPHRPTQRRTSSSARRCWKTSSTMRPASRPHKRK